MTSRLPSQKIEALKKELSDFKENLLDNHIRRLDIDYFNEFSSGEIRKHLLSIQKLSAKVLCDVRLKQKKGGGYLLTVVGFDVAGFFSIVTGLLTLHGFDIRSGKSFTYGRFTSEKSQESRGRTGLRKQRNAKIGLYYLERRKLIDTFEIVSIFPEGSSPEFEKNFFQELHSYLELVHQNKFSAVRKELNTKVGNFLSKILLKPEAKLLPIEIEIDSDGTYTILRISGANTPAFLFSLSNVITRKRMKIHKVDIHTDIQEVSDVIYITDKYDRTVSDKQSLERLRATIALVKQFTLLLPFAPDPGAAMKHFYQFLDELIGDDSSTLNILDVENPIVLSTIAKIFGTGEYFWEEFVGMQYKNLLPLLKDIDRYNIQKDTKRLKRELDEILLAGKTFREKTNLINRYKDKELFRLDLLYLIYPEKTFMDFSLELNDLAEAIFTCTIEVIYQDLENCFGRPMRGEKVCSFGVFGLGKFGGYELGYASDIEIILIYEGVGNTEGQKNSISNSEFFNKLVENLKTAIRAKKAGIFEIDLRLRPYGNKGGLSCTYSLWDEYYSDNGKAYDYERQALLRLRPIYGEPALTEKVMKTRDKILFGGEPIAIENSMELRNKQLKNLIEPGKVNAKFSEGGLVDLEYSIQFLQLKFGGKYPGVRNVNTLRALEGLLEVQAIDPAEFEKLFSCYAFLRRLINALRVVRGNAKDLVIPQRSSDEYLFLTRRLGYAPKGRLSPTEQFTEDVEKNFQTVRQFYVKRFIEKKEIAFTDSGLSKLLPKKKVTFDEIKERMMPFGVEDPRKAFNAFGNMFRNVKDKNIFFAAFVLIERHIAASPDPDQVVIRLEKYLSHTEDPSRLLKQIIFHPRLLELMVLTFGYSEYLSDILINEPNLIWYLSQEDTLFVNKSRDYFKRELEALFKNVKNFEKKMDIIRKYQKREMLRLGLRDIYSAARFERTVREISNLADTIVREIYRELILEEGYDLEPFLESQSVIALGKLGGRELNYSSDIDILFVLADDLPKKLKKSKMDKINEALIKHLTKSSRFGQLFRVDLRLRPYGRFGTLSGTFHYHKDYYEKKADGWELQAWLKARTIAGNHHAGSQLIHEVQGILLSGENKLKAYESITRLREKMLRKLEREDLLKQEVKLGPGGIRSVEFIVQKLQIQYGQDYPDILSGNTLQALSKLTSHHLMEETLFHQLKSAYIFLRNIEHRIQLLGLQQLHVLPLESSQLAKLAKRLNFQNRLEESAGDQFLKRYSEVTNQISETYEKSFKKY